MKLTNGTQYHILNDISRAWNTQLTSVTIWFQLPIDKIHYCLFNLLHLLEHCLIRSDLIIDSNGTTFGKTGMMQVQFICNTSDLKQINKDVNKYIKSKNIAQPLELHRLGSEMYQVISPDTHLEFPDFLFNQDIYNHTLDPILLYELYTQLKITDVFIQHSGYQSVAGDVMFILPDLEPVQKHLDLYHEQFKIKQLATVLQCDYFECDIPVENQIFMLLVQERINAFYINKNTMLIGKDIVNIDIQKNDVMQLDDYFSPDLRFFMFDRPCCYVQLNQILIDSLQVDQIYVVTEQDEKLLKGIQNNIESYYAKRV